jgi:hypothetical protein
MFRPLTHSINDDAGAEVFMGPCPEHIKLYFILLEKVI